MTDERKGDALLAAKEDGVLSGLEINNQAADCPFGHRHLALRTAWLAGFAIGRNKRRTSIAHRLMG